MGAWRTTAAQVHSNAMPRLKDVICKDPRVLFVGINPGSRSGALGLHFAGKGNPFWRLLHASGLTPVVLAPAECPRLAEFGLALTNVCPRTTRTAAELTKEELAAGARTLRRKVARLRPQVVALVGLTIYPLLFHEPARGAGLKSVTLGVGRRSNLACDGEARVFVLPNPSGLNASFPGFEQKLVWFRALRELLDATGQSARDQSSS